MTGSEDRAERPPTSDYKKPSAGGKPPRAGAARTGRDFVYQSAADGKRFLVNVVAGGESASAPPLTVWLNWQAALKK